MKREGAWPFISEPRVKGRLHDRKIGSRTRQKSGTDRIILAVYTAIVLPRVGQKVV